MLPQRTGENENANEKLDNLKNRWIIYSTCMVEKWKLCTDNLLCRQKFIIECHRGSSVVMNKEFSHFFLFFLVWNKCMFCLKAPEGL